MNKAKIAICLKDVEYQIRFVNCFMNHYKHMYELHVFTGLEQLKLSKPLEYAAIIVSEYSTEELSFFVERGEILLDLREDLTNGSDMADVCCWHTEKYQEVYKIAEVLERMTADKIHSRGKGTAIAECESIGVYSLTQEMYQVPFAALLGNIWGENYKVLILDLQHYSGLPQMDEGIASMGLEDLLSVVLTGNYSRSRVLECIQHGPGWDYICAVQNNQCLSEGTREMYEALMKLMIGELGYQKIIINFGANFLGQMEMMARCQHFYLLSGKENMGQWREEHFYQEIRRQEKEDFLGRIQKMEIPAMMNREGSWTAITERWNWGHLGEILRCNMKGVECYGAVM